MIHNEFLKFHPVTNLIYFISGIAAVCYVNNPVLFIFVLTVLILCNIILDRAKSLKSKLIFYIVIAAGISLLNPLFSHRGQIILFYMFGNPMTLESVVYGVKSGLSLMSVLIMFSMFNIIINPDKFLYLFSRFAKQTAFVIMLGLRFIPTLSRRITEISQVNVTHNNPGVKLKLKQKISGAMNTLMTLIIWSLEDAVVTAQSMRSRGYGVKTRDNTNIERTFYFAYKFKKRDALFIFADILIFAMFLMTNTNYQIYPTFSDKIINFADYKSFANILFLIALLALPVIVQILNYIKWSLIYNADNRV
ncbi:MAG: energy-coupling factor transporter transmembrane protein EcfT [Oscillospiraceae bacterium]|nr:energy-coupling factor transporter transmembrane protein EcfT [Oscillospiraceae bacterium]